jgi:hypothetical protein
MIKLLQIQNNRLMMRTQGMDADAELLQATEDIEKKIVEESAQNIQDIEEYLEDLDKQYEEYYNNMKKNMDDLKTDMSEATIPGAKFTYKDEGGVMVLKPLGQGEEESTHGGGRKPKHCKNTGIKKEILGKDRCIYKIQGDRKEYVKYKGELVTVKDFKELHKKPTKSKSKPKKEEKPTKPKPKSKPKKEEKKPTKSKSKPKKEEKPTKSKAKPKKEEKPTKPKPKSKSTKK